MQGSDAAESANVKRLREKGVKIAIGHAAENLADAEVVVVSSAIPVEIAAVLKAARESTRGQVIAVVQPHRYTRLAALFEQFCTCFNDADAVIVAHVYPAGEAPIEGADRDALVQGLRNHGHRQIVPLDGSEKLAGLVAAMAKPGDYIVCLGAGSITQWAYALPAELAAVAT